ncbi:ABC transporter ATP-binding protein [Exiguobacterium sp. B2(2022)]|uniref:ABC transporter ATP-binding protein n=1 Tax=Exiguobacterium sp. B2(2022) TaxID=2992755 RepID=UPI00237BFC0E|nr:ABC transporter ATP-binding protein [Exiguobacterium sp. B2(2022)]MDE0562501.1 ABC transporter ATP-binding protein/permease [Exiguobacterium sp. B2(2022)]
MIDQYELDPVRRKKTIRSLVGYAKQVKRSIFLGLTLLFLAVGAELAGPYIAKIIIDEHIVAIERDWVQVESGGSVSFDGNSYEKETRLDGQDVVQPVSIVQTTDGYYLVPDAVMNGGIRDVEGDVLTITRGDETATYDNIVSLSSTDVFQFYQTDLRAVLMLSGLYVVLLLLAAGLNWGQQMLLQRSAHSIVKTMRLDVMKHLQTIPVRYFDQTPIGKIVSRVTNDTETIRDLYLGVLARVFQSVVMMIGVLIAMFFLDVRLGFVSLIIIPVVIVWIKLFQRFSTKNNFRVRALVADMNAQLNESIQTMPIIQSYVREDLVYDEFNEKNSDNFQTRRKLLKLDALMSHNLVNFFRNMALALLIWFVGAQTLGGGSILTLGILYAYIDYVSRIFEPVTQIMNQLSPLQQALVSADRMFQLLDEKGEPVSSERIPRFKGEVVFDDVTFSYEAGKPVLQQIELHAAPGETIALVGHTGSGKSSIMNLLMRFYDPSKGVLRIDGMDVTKLPTQAVRDHLGIVLQDPFLFTGTIRTNITLGDESITDDQVWKALTAVGADRFVKQLPKGIDEPVIERGASLSSGERQLISFARALVFDPAILVLDEATASVDSETEALIQEALKTLTYGRTTFVIAHRLSTIREADQILVLDHGRIIERGNHQSLIEFGGVYARMHELQSKQQAIS